MPNIKPTILEFETENTYICGIIEQVLVDKVKKFKSISQDDDTLIQEIMQKHISQDVPKKLFNTTQLDFLSNYARAVLYLRQNSTSNSSDSEFNKSKFRIATLRFNEFSSAKQYLKQFLNPNSDINIASFDLVLLAIPNESQYVFKYNYREDKLPESVEDLFASGLFARKIKYPKLIVYNNGEQFFQKSIRLNSLIVHPVDDASSGIYFPAMSFLLDNIYHISSIDSAEIESMFIGGSSKVKAEISLFKARSIPFTDQLAPEGYATTDQLTYFSRVISEILPENYSNLSIFK